MRRLPIFLVVDISESMAGQNISLMQQGLGRLISQLREDPFTLEMAYIEVIAFAGRAKVLTPLVDLMSLNPPDLPLGSGTSIGQALDLVMNRIDSQVIKNSEGKKGDYKPLVYFLTDGAGTDNANAAIRRWKSSYSRSAKLIAIGVGKYADLRIFQDISDLTYRVENSDLSLAYKTLIQSIKDSIQSQSRSVGMGKDMTPEVRETNGVAIARGNNARGIDENFAIFIGKCSRHRLPYIMKYEKFDIVSKNYPPTLPYEIRTQLEMLPREVLQQLAAKQPEGFYCPVGIYAADSSFDSWSDTSGVAQTVQASQLMGSAGSCPHCHNDDTSGIHRGCGFLCDSSHSTSVTCPHCNMNLYKDSGGGSGFDFAINRSKG
ncbi:MAG: VWA domain-containing protein [Cardiobacteriaceae bacterium]|nr:VWA domain-containing protein [Cardiobacteriaceae bacterium]